jgi:hypothetical protein
MTLDRLRQESWRSTQSGETVCVPDPVTGLGAAIGRFTERHGRPPTHLLLTLQGTMRVIRAGEQRRFALERALGHQMMLNGLVGVTVGGITVQTDSVLPDADRFIHENVLIRVDSGDAGGQDASKTD